MSKIICFVGFSKSGKDYLAEKVLERYKDILVPYAMGDYLKVMYAYANGITVEELEKVKDVHRPRILYFAETLVKFVEPNFYVNHFLKIKEDSKNYLIKDLRFFVEREALKHLDNIVYIYIDRDEKYLNKACGNQITPDMCSFYFKNGEDDEESLFDYIDSVLC